LLTFAPDNLADYKIRG